MRANIHTELSPTVGSEQQGEELIKSLLADFETDPGKLWSTNILRQEPERAGQRGRAGKAAAHAAGGTQPPAADA